MKRMICTLAACMFLLPPASTRAQGNMDWEELWMLPQPSTPSGAYGWMAGQRTYTGLAYDKWRDVLYVVNPGLCSIGATTYYCPKIHVLDARTGLYATAIGRAASGVIGVTPGEGGQLPLPLDTIVTAMGWGGGYGSFSQGQFSVYKIDVDDEGRVYAGNLVSPLYGICFPGPPPNCDPIFLGQGPYRLYRWDTPWSTPRRVYATLNAGQNALGNPNQPGSSELSWTRWGDALDVVGKRMADSAQTDSVRVFISGGAFSGQSSSNQEIAVLIADTRSAPRVTDSLGRDLDMRLGVDIVTPIQGVAASGIAATGPSALDSIWTDNPMDSARLMSQGRSAGSYPQQIGSTVLRALSENTLTGTGYSGPIAYIPSLFGRQLLICADGMPSNPGNPTVPNTYTQARVMDVTIPGQEMRHPSLGDTPPLGIKTLSPNSGLNNYITDVDYKIEVDSVTGQKWLVLFVLMSNNGIAAFRSRYSVPVSLVNFRAVQREADVQLSWDVASEVNNLGFGVERSFNGGSAWETITFIRGRGSDPTPASYEYRDPVIAAHRTTGSAMYRLRQMNSDGSAEYSPVVTVYFHATPSGIALAQNHPNPVSASGDGAATIGYQLSTPGLVTLRVFNTLGEEIAMPVRGQREAGSWQARLDVSRLPAGSYLYELDVDGAAARKTMIVVK